MKALVCAALMAAGAAALSFPLLHHWAVSTECVETDTPRIVFTLIGSAASGKLPILILSYRNESWNALLTCGESLQGRAANFSFAWDGQNEQAIWTMTRDHGAAFAPEANSFIFRLMGWLGNPCAPLST
jgi:hypothetical protein